MREGLKNIDQQLSKLTIHEYDQTLQLIDEIFESRQIQVAKNTHNVTVYDENGNEKVPEDGDLDEAIADFEYYAWIDTLIVHQFAIWRLQGIFEGILKQEFIENKKLFGIKAKMDYVLNDGYNISDDDYNEILDWANLRNTLSHYPTESLHPIVLERDDITEYAELLNRVTSGLLDQKLQRQPT